MAFISAKLLAPRDAPLKGEGVGSEADVVREVA